MFSSHNYLNKVIKQMALFHATQHYPEGNRRWVKAREQLSQAQEWSGPVQGLGSALR